MVSWHAIWDQKKLLDEKTGSEKSRDTVPLCSSTQAPCWMATPKFCAFFYGWCMRKNLQLSRRSPDCHTGPSCPVMHFYIEIRLSVTVSNPNLSGYVVPLIDASGFQVTDRKQGANNVQPVEGNTGIGVPSLRTSLRIKATKIPTPTMYLLRRLLKGPSHQIRSA